MAEDQENTENTEESPSIEDLANEFQPSPTPTQQEPTVDQNLARPDPTLDPDGYANYVDQQNALLKQQLEQLSNSFNATTQQKAYEQAKADLNKAVDIMGSKLEGVDRDLVEGVLHTKYNNDPSFQKIWDNRAQNPSAFERALGVIAEQYQGKFVAKQDPQLTENQRAVNDLMKSSGNPSEPEPVSDKLAKADDNDFDRAWADIVAGR